MASLKPRASFHSSPTALHASIGADSLIRPGGIVFLHPPHPSDMAGHNKWSKVKHIKGAADAKRGKIFSKLSKEITLAAKAGGGSSDMNARLRSAILSAKAQNMPNDTIDRAVKKGTGEIDGAAIEEIVYEGYGQGGVAFMVEVATDNRNRSAQDMRTTFFKNNGTFADAGSVAYMFQRRGEIRIDKAAFNEEQATELALESGADDVTSDEEDWILYTTLEQLFTVGAALKERNVTTKSQNLIYLPSNTLLIDDPDVARQLVRLYDALDDYDDTQNVFANFELSDQAAAALE